MILNISVNDYANFGHDNAKALRSIGVDCVDVCLKPHVFNYQSASTVVPSSELVKLMRKASVIQLFHDPIQFKAYIPHIKCPLVLWHTGSNYRQMPDHVHKMFDHVTTVHVCALPELYLQCKKRVQNKPVHYVVGSVDTEYMAQFQRERGDVLRVAHYPSNPIVKGTDKIITSFDRLATDGIDAELITNTEKVPYHIQLMRMSHCDLYVELMATHQNGVPYGSFGITALEAAAMGKVVITNCVEQQPYLDFYGTFPFEICNDIADMEAVICEYVALSRQEFEEKQQEFYRTLVNNHSYLSTGRKIYDTILKGL